MAFTFTSMDVDVLSQAGLATLRNKNSLFTQISRNFSTATGTQVLVPYMNADTASIWATSTGYGPESATVQGITIQLGEPFKKSYELSPLQAGAYNFDYIATVAFPNQIGALVTECAKKYYSLVDATTFPTQYSQSVASYELVESGSQAIFTSGSTQPQVCLVSQKFDKQLKADLVTRNYLVGAQIIHGDFQNGYVCGNATVLPSYDLTTTSTGADAIVVVADTILAASRLPNVEGPVTRVFDIQDPQTGFAIRSWVWTHPVNFTPMLTSAVQYSVARGRTGFGARLKVN